ncbi:monosaccharide ABC transporter membrane protein (CUT2 family) [Roseibium marinum]|uniref:Monosaccharide ABC transporter membrane protein (CUT2 family) n=2 Tax=Roseibium marinum TaxID=281252 RepID=A0A2S3UXQ1_9HYPH|nr:ABC transporter permease [Roseibium marinum]POF32229.1 monosaccharide ABC transporter membrane protein (CUT2 family) [Roseibium marinum]
MTSASEGTAGKSPRRISVDLKTLGPALALLLLCIIGFLLNPAFVSEGNLTNLLTRSAFIGIIAVGATFVITAGGIDLSVGSMAAAIAGVMIIVMDNAVETLGTGVPTVLLGCGVAIILGIGAGWINGVLTTKGKIEAFIVTLGTMGIYRSLVTYFADGGTLSLNFEVRGTYRPVYYDSFLGLPFPVWVFIAVAICGWLLLNRTAFGRYCTAIGSNEAVAKYSAINVDRIKTLTYIIQGLCVAFATIIYVPRLGSASASTGVLWELEAIAAVIIGGTVLKGGYGRIGGTILGALILTTIGNILNFTDMISNYLNGTMQGLIIIVAVFLQRSDWKLGKNKKS